MDNVGGISVVTIGWIGRVCCMQSEEENNDDGDGSLAVVAFGGAACYACGCIVETGQDFEKTELWHTVDDCMQPVGGNVSVSRVQIRGGLSMTAPLVPSLLESGCLGQHPPEQQEPECSSFLPDWIRHRCEPLTATLTQAIEFPLEHFPHPKPSP